MGPGWVLETVSADRSPVGLIARQLAQHFDYKTSLCTRLAASTKQADGIVIFTGNKDNVNALVVRNYMTRVGKPWVEDPSVAELQTFILTRTIRTLHVYGTKTKAAADQAQVVLATGLLPF